MSGTPERLQYFLNDPHSSRALGVEPLRHVARPLPRTSYRTSSFCSAGSPLPSEASTRSSATRSSCNSDRKSSRRTSISSTSTAPSIPPWQPAELNQHQLTMEFDYGYDLPCECLFMDCQIRFHPEYHQEWIAHGISHFTLHPLPRKLICTFCSVEFDSGSHGDRLSNYTRRMNHIGQHFYDNRILGGSLETHPRPDYHLLEHFNRIGILDNEHYNAAIQYTERPSCEGLQRRGFVTPEQRERQAKEERESREHYDQAKEDRQRKREDRERRGKGRSTYPADRSRNEALYKKR
jgi:hypothetical protein